ncbi:MAG: DUF423 domain-containing protein [Dokdonella sp.]
MNARLLAGLSATIAGATAVAAGAFGAHALRATLSVDALSIWHTAVEYQFWHALALLALAVTSASHRARAVAVATISFAVGIVLFCGSLYALALDAPNWIGVITPIGGLAFIVGWLALAWLFWSEATTTTPSR